MGVFTLDDDDAGLVIPPEYTENIHKCLVICSKCGKPVFKAWPAGMFQDKEPVVDGDGGEDGGVEGFYLGEWVDGDGGTSHRGPAGTSHGECGMWNIPCSCVQ
jgi:hypothetical protein